jgi:hypothetical protein
MVLSSARDNLRELLLLEKAERESASLSDTQRTAMRTYADAATSRVTVARDIRGTAQTPVALELYRRASLFYTLAFIASEDQTLDAATLTPEQAYRKLDEVLQAKSLRSPPELARVKPFLLSDDPLDSDRMSPDQAEQASQELEVTTRWLSRLFELRSPQQLRIARFVRLGFVAASALALVVWLFALVLAPKNVARGRPTTISGTTLGGTTGAGAVDGSSSGLFGYHSALEESPWLSIDLGSRYLLNKVKVYGRGDGYYDQSVPLALEVSDDGTTYRQIAQRAEPFSSSDPWVVKPDVPAQFIRLHTLRHSYLVLGEVEVFGPKAK